MEVYVLKIKLSIAERLASKRNYKLRQAWSNILNMFFYGVFHNVSDYPCKRMI